MIASMQMNINHCRVWLFYNEMGAVAQCPNNWGVGSAFHPKKIHILYMYFQKFPLTRLDEDDDDLVVESNAACLKVAAPGHKVSSSRPGQRHDCHDCGDDDYGGRHHHQGGTVKVRSNNTKSQM